MLITQYVVFTVSAAVLAQGLHGCLAPHLRSVWLAEIICEAAGCAPSHGSNLRADETWRGPARVHDDD